MKATVNGVSLNYQIDGKEGAPWLTFSNSLATTLNMWDDQVEALKDQFHILRYDKRGHGDSEVVKGPYTLEQLAGDVLGLWDHLGITKSHFVGLSIGGMTAHVLALNNADRLDRLVICDSSSHAEPEFNKSWDDRIAVAEEKGIPALVEPTLTRWCAPGFVDNNKDRADKMRGMILKTSVEGYAGCGRAIQKLAFKARLGEFKTPTLLIVGKQDVLYQDMLAMKDLIPGADFVELEPAGHISNFEQPDAFNKALTSFLG